MYIIIVIINNTIYFIGIIKSTSNMWDIHSGNFFQTHVIHEYKTNLVLLFSYVNSFGSGKDYSNFGLFVMSFYVEFKYSLMPTYNLK